MALQSDTSPLDRLRGIIRRLDSTVVAFSGGVDSGLLAYLAHQELGEKAVAVTAVSPSLSGAERRGAVEFAECHGLKHVLIESAEFFNPRYASNPENRCYFCKGEVFRICRDYGQTHGLRWVVEGTHSGDLGGHRPGMKAAEEAEVRWPLVEAGLVKTEVREIAKSLRLDLWDKPSMACLASRIPTGTEVTGERVASVEGCEEFLRSRGFRHYRVRWRGEEARVEVGPDEVTRLNEPETLSALEEHCRRFGFKRVTVAPEGYAAAAEDGLS